MGPKYCQLNPLAWCFTAVKRAIELVETIAFNEFTERIAILPKNFSSIILKLNHKIELNLCGSG